MGWGLPRLCESKLAAVSLIVAARFAVSCRLALFAVVLLCVSVTSCSSSESTPRSTTRPASPESSASEDSPESAPKPSDPQPAGSAGTPLAAFPPTRDRWSYLPEAVSAQVPAIEADSERTELQELRAAAAAPRPPGSDDRFTRVAEGTPTRFMDLAVDVGRRRSLNPLRMARNSAIIAVAAHEAALAAARTTLSTEPSPAQVDSAFAEPISGVDSVGLELPDRELPPELVTASAQRTAACDLYKVECTRFERLQQIAKNRVVASGSVWPSTLQAAEKLGTTVGSSVLTFASSDGALPWAGSPSDLPSGGDWVPTPEMFAPALEPLAGSWRPWNFEGANQFRPPTPPARGSAEHKAATDQVFAEATNISDRNLRLAAFWDQGPGTSTPPGYWMSDIAADSLRQATVADQASGLALLATAEADAGIASWDSKYFFRTVRPVTVIRDTKSPQWLPSLQTPPFPAYVSGHAAYSTAAAQVMSALRPERTDEFFDAAAEATDSRLTGGIHYWYDLVQGATLGQKVGAAALDKAGLTGVPSEVVPVAERLRYTSADVRSRPAS
ncbi:MAG: vanadium-dependent haloperoxidase [Microthrixaceae bacterium]